MTTARRRVLDLVERYGAELFDDSERGELDASVWTPAGSVWKATGDHVIAVAYKSDRPAGWAALLADIQQGTEECTLGHCETCERGE